MDLVNYLPLEFGQHSPLELANQLKESNLDPFWQNWLNSKQEVFDLAGHSWVYIYGAEGLGLKNLKRPKERAITVGARDSKNSFMDFMSRLCVGKKDLQIIDATAGLLNDTHSLQRLGFPLTSYEANPLLALLIQTNILLTTSFKQLKSKWEFRPISFTSKELTSINKKSSIIVYDPMFKAKTHKTMPSLEMQVLNELESQFPNLDLSPAEFLKWQDEALNIVVKRPDKAPYLFDVSPKYSINTKLLRWDIY